MATYNVVNNINSGSPDTWQPFIVRMVIDFSKFTYTSGDVLQGPELEEGTLAILAWQRVIKAGDADLNAATTLGFTDAPAAWHAGLAFDVDGTADTTAAITLATVDPVDEQTTSARNYMLLTSADTETVTSGIIEIVVLCVKVSGPMRG